jgi:dUTP pyrophosphatase
MQINVVYDGEYRLEKAYEGDAGWDIKANEYAAIEPGKKAIIGTGVRFASMPSDVYCRVASRSGLSVKFDLEVGAGVIDSSYRNEVKIVLRNFGEMPFHVKPGDRIAQLVFTKLSPYDLVTVTTDDMENSERGMNGFGSSGV